MENHGLINGSAAFYDKVTNYGEIAAADCFYGEYISMSGSSNSSYAELTLDLDTHVPASAPEGWDQAKDLLSKKILRGQKLPQRLPSISRAGYDLKGWLVAEDQPFDENSPITGDITVKADWSLKQGTVLHKLQFDANGGNITMASQWFVMGETRTLDDCDTSLEDRWHFLGWNTKQDPPRAKPMRIRTRSLMMARLQPCMHSGKRTKDSSRRKVYAAYIITRESSNCI